MHISQSRGGLKLLAQRNEILQEALSLFSVKGYDGVSMSDIAEVVGIKAASHL